jgi:hypothetical protein
MPGESSPEYAQVERPFIEQLQALGWDLCWLLVPSVWS